MRPISEEEIPVHSTKDLDNIPEHELGIPCTADGYSARVFVRGEGGWGTSEKIVIIFTEQHPIWKEGYFLTKYYFLREPGKLEWGHGEKPITLLHA